MGSYIDEPPAPEGLGGLLFSAAIGLVGVGLGAWGMFESYSPQVALGAAAAGAAAIVVVVVWKARRLGKSSD